MSTDLSDYCTLPSSIFWHRSGSLDSEDLSEEWVTHENALGFRPAVNLTGTVDEQREVLKQGCALRDAHLSDLDTLKSKVEAKDDSIGAASGLDIPIRVYHAKGKDATKPAPGAVFYHGGGWILGNIEADDIFCRMIARDLGHVVVSVEYRLVPEHPYPGPVDDCFDAFVYTSQHATELGIDSNQIYVTGNSAGGHLAAAVALKAVASGYKLAAQILRIPFTCDPAHFPGKLPARPTVPIFNDEALRVMFGSFVPDESRRKEAYASPLLADVELIKKLPPTYIDVCSADPLAVPAIAYAKLLEENGVAVRTFVLEGMPHGSFVLFPDLPSSRAAWTACVEGTQWALQEGQDNK